MAEIEFNFQSLSLARYSDRSIYLKTRGLINQASLLTCIVPFSLNPYDIKSICAINSLLNPYQLLATVANKVTTNVYPFTPYYTSDITVVPSNGVSRWIRDR